MLRHVQCTFSRFPLLFVVAAACSLVACGDSPYESEAIASPPASSALTAAESSVASSSQETKVVVCHKGQDLRIAMSAVQGHVRHGDSVGSCTSGATCPCFNAADIAAAANACTSNVASSCGLGDPAFLFLSCDPGGSVPPGLLGIYLSETADGGACSRDDVNGTLTLNGLSLAEFQACVDVMAASGYCL